MRDIPVGNGSLLVNFDDKYQIRDIYFPHVGQENHTEGFPFRFGVWVDGSFSWIFADEWERTLKYLPNTLVTDVTLRNPDLEIEIRCNDTVVANENIYLRRISIRNLIGADRNVRLFLHHDFRIYENKVGDTAYYDPDALALIHYKKHRYFLINTVPHFDEFATGRKAFKDREGTWRDAEDGELHGAAITEGSVDSTLGLHFALNANATQEVFYWIAAGTSRLEVFDLNAHVLNKTPSQYFHETSEIWRQWAGRADVSQIQIPASIVTLYERSLLMIRTQIDNGGAIIAATDHDVTERATDHYSYLWTRDGAFIANALDEAGYPEISRSFFKLCSKLVDIRGYFLQKYNPDGSVGSGWHPFWDSRRRVPLVPIQEDETALVLWALWQHYDKYRDVEFIKGLQERLIEPCADFLVEFRDPSTHLPHPSWNLWEDRLGVHTFTCASVVAGLRAAANFTQVLGDENKAAGYAKAAEEIVEAMREHLYSETLGRFLRGIHFADNGQVADETIDASVFAIFYFECFKPDDPLVRGTMQAVADKLVNKGEYGGVARFENDGYMRTSEETVGNSWIICTLWLAEYYIASAKVSGDLDKALEILEWVTKRAFPSGVLAEQIDPTYGKPLSVSPLTWSHSTFVATVLHYAEKLQHLAYLT
jgi:oligosaccharide amylase